MAFGRILELLRRDNAIQAHRGSNCLWQTFLYGWAAIASTLQGEKRSPQSDLLNSDRDIRSRCRGPRDAFESAIGEAAMLSPEAQRKPPPRRREFPVRVLSAGPKPL